MQFHQQGYVSTDPRILPAAGVGLDRPSDLPDELDVLVVGAGPAGMILAAQLSQFPEITTRLIDQRAGRLELGHADGIACRSVETFQAFGFAAELREEAYRITETAFWGPDPAHHENLVRTARTPDDPRGVSEFHHLICNQARVQDYFARFMHRAPARMSPDYGIEFVALHDTGEGTHPLEVTLRRSAGERAGEEFTVHARHVVGCDGARSLVRRAIGRRLEGDSANHAWGVMDVLVDTDFPDIRTKCLITSAEGGNILLIPREGGSLVRLYVDLGTVTADNASTIRSTEQAAAIDIARRILAPHRLDVLYTAWYSVYEVGQRVTDKFDDVPAELVGRRIPRVFIAGDACHTHSAKAGQGMNVSMQDGFNLGWKLGHVLTGRAPEALLDSYSAERQPIAQQLIDFDREWSSLMAAKPLDPEHPELGGVAPEVFQQFYLRSFDFTMGFGTEYSAAPLTRAGEGQELATGFPLGQRFHSAPVRRVSDANPIELGHQATADGRWRVYAFADRDGRDLEAWAQWFGADPTGPGPRYTPADGDADAVFDTKLIVQQPYDGVDVWQVPELFTPRHAPYGVRDTEKVFAAETGADIFEARGLDRDGVVVVVRPDLYVAAIFPLTARAEVVEFFDGVLTPVPQRQER